MLLEVELLLDVVPEQVADLLVVDLQVGGVHQILHVLAGINGLEGKEISRNYIESTVNQPRKYVRMTEG